MSVLSMLQYDFMLRALAAGAATGLICPALGVFLVLRRYSFLADTVAHISLAGVAFGLWIGLDSSFVPLVIIAVAVLGVLLAEHLRVRRGFSADALLAFIMSAGLALAVIFFGLAGSGALDITSYLFGSLITVSAADLWLILAVAGVVGSFLALFFKELFFICSDEESARVSGLPVDRINRLFIFLVALTVGVSLRVVGTLLVGALMVVPVLAAILLGRSFRQVFLLSLALGLVSTLLGLTASYRFGLAAGGCVVMVACGLFLAFYVSRALVGVYRRRSILKEKPEPQ